MSKEKEQTPPKIEAQTITSIVEPIKESLKPENIMRVPPEPKEKKSDFSNQIDFGPVISEIQKGFKGLEDALKPSITAPILPAATSAKEYQLFDELDYLDKGL